MSSRLQLSSSYGGCVVTVTCIVTLGYYLHKRKVDQLERKWDEQRKGERKGRIRAECRLRELEKRQLQNGLDQERNSSITQSTENDVNYTAEHLPTKMVGENPSDPSPSPFIMSPIGIVTSPYTKRMGTPRQPQLVPASRGYIQFTVPEAALDGIDSYSHVWILFRFHANTNLASSTKTKIRPPRAPNHIKVGQLSTRSPHRPNPIGLSLCEVAQWLPEKRQLHIRGLDLVHGTPVFDIKPCVPWDIPTSSASTTSTSEAAAAPFVVPDWVKQDDAISHVDFTPRSLDELQELVTNGNLSPLYTDANDGFQAATDTLMQILAQDPRSSHRGLKNNSRGTTADSRSCSIYSLIFCQVQVDFEVSDKGVGVRNIKAVEFDKSAYVDGIPLISELG